jgi:hypothetical protein
MQRWLFTQALSLCGSAPDILEKYAWLLKPKQFDQFAMVAA